MKKLLPSGNQWMIIFLFLFTKMNAQTLYYNDQFEGGVTCGGYSPEYSTGGTGTITISIAAGSSIHKAYLLAGRHGNAADLNVKLNGNILTFNSANQASLTFQSPNYGGNSAVHAIDVTGIVDSSVNTYTLMVSNQGGPNDRYNDFYLYVAYDNPALPTISTAIFLNQYDLTDAVTWTLPLPYAWDTTFDAAISLFAGYACSNGDGESVSVDGTYLGDYYGPESNSGNCGGPLGNFYYENGTLTGLGDDDADQVMSGPDVISNASAIVTNGNMSSSIIFDSQSGVADNAIWAVIIANGGGCPLTIAHPDTTICAGNSVQLTAIGGTSFAWTPATGLSDSSIANPVATPDSTTTYIVSASDSNGCFSSDSVLIVVQPAGYAGADATVCKSDSAQLSAFGGISYSWQPVTGLSNPNIPDPLCYISATTTYTVTIISANGCVTTDELVVNVVLTVMAPTITLNGYILTCSPEVSYQWKLNSVDIPGATNQTYTITTGGFYSCAVVTYSGCPTESALFYAAPVGIAEPDIEHVWEIYPNPATDYLFIYTTEYPAEITIINILGQEVIASRIWMDGLIRIVVSQLTEGSYYVKLKTNNGCFIKKWLKK
ncbi:MAG: T9SS type A sorting domain-containing protein [Chitinophagales bacterium]